MPHGGNTRGEKGRPALTSGFERMRGALVIAGVALGLLATGAGAVAANSISQAPILRVLRPNDVPEAKNEELPSGALTATQFAFSNDSTSAARHAESRTLEQAGFRSSAIALFYASGRTFLKSTAVEFAAPSLAARALHAEAQLATHSQAPAHDKVTLKTDRNIKGASIETFAPAAPGQAGGVEILAVSGSYILTLQAIATPDTVNAAKVEQLLKVVIARN
jgi:hypothetical protein